MKYVGDRHPSGVRVSALKKDGGYHLEHIMRHSPDGFEWGYGGSGPADLARCLLIDHLGLQADARDGKPLSIDYPGPTFYQDFKAEVVMNLGKMRWSLTGEEIDAWIKQREDEA